MEDKFLTFRKESEGIYKEKGSKFLSFGYPISAEEEVRPVLEELKKKYHDAQHHCYAYMLGKDQNQFRANDDGEPSHSEGNPILGQIKSHALSNVLIVVVRYFGGTKLGIGGLIKAYKSAAEAVIAANEIVEGTLTNQLCFSYDYSHTNDVMRIINAYEVEIINQKFESACEVTLRCRRSLTDVILLHLGKISSFALK